jgi:hypothetical protein
VSRNSLSYFLTFGCLSLLVSGCGGDAPKPSNSASPSSAASPAASAADPIPSAAPVAVASPAALVAKTSETTTTNLQPSFSGDIAAGLIPASDAEIATKAVAKGRPDPFSAVIAQPVAPSALRIGTANPTPATNSGKVASTTATSTKKVQQLVALNPTVKSGDNLGLLHNKLGKNLDLASITNPLANKSTGKKTGAIQPLVAKVMPKTAIGNAKASIASVGSIPAKAPLVPGKTALLTPPAAAPILPALAKAIQVSGVSEINGQTQVIVKLPGESFSRYLSVGEKVLNGKVLIKRVQDPTAIAPIVVLEEAGVEVQRKVGEKPVSASPSKETLETPE